MTQRITDLIARLRVLAGTFVTYLLTATVALQWLLSQDIILNYPPAVQWIGSILSGLGAVLVVVRSVSPVPKPERGILPNA